MATERDTSRSLHGPSSYNNAQQSNKQNNKNDNEGAPKSVASAQEVDLQSSI